MTETQQNTVRYFRYFPNKFAGTCKICKNRVGANAGFVGKESNGYVAYCKEHVPVRIGAIGPVVRKMNADGTVITPYEPQNLPLLRSLPGARWNPDVKGWTFSLAMGDRERVLEIADRLGLEVASELRKTVTTEQAVAATVAGLYPFQVKGVNWLSLRDKALLGDDMGLGKTVQALIALPKNDVRAIVVAPASLKYNWRNEAKKWRSDLKTVICSGKDSWVFPKDGEVVIINFDILPARFEEMSEADKAEFAKCILIVDEAHRCKNYKTARAKRINAMSRAAKAVWGLTGTPLLNRPGDLFGVLSSLNMAKEAFSSWTNYMKLFNATKNSWGGIDWGTPDPSVPERLRRVMLRRRKDDVLPDLPKKTITTLTVNGLSKSLEAKLDRLEQEWGDVVEAGILPPFEEFSGIRAELAESRIPAMLEMVEDHEESETPLIVASAHLAPIDSLSQREGWAVITGSTKPEDRAEVVRKFQAGKLKGVGLTIQAGGVGLTLTYGWKMLFVDLDWVPANNQQCADRICRIGQTRPCEIVQMVSNHPLDQHVVELIASKMAMIDAAVEAEVAVVIPQGQQAETEEQYAARMVKVEEIAARPTRMTAKKADLSKRMKARAKSELLPLTPERKMAIDGAFAFLLSVCDGAEAKDGQGWNKPDSIIARYVLAGKMKTDEDYEIGFAMCSRYSRQLLGRFPILFKEVTGG